MKPLPSGSVMSSTTVKQKGNSMSNVPDTTIPQVLLDAVEKAITDGFRYVKLQKDSIDSDFYAPIGWSLRVNALSVAQRVANHFEKISVEPDLVFHYEIGDDISVTIQDFLDSMDTVTVKPVIDNDDLPTILTAISQGWSVKREVEEYCRVMPQSGWGVDTASVSTKYSDLNYHYNHEGHPWHRSVCDDVENTVYSGYICSYNGEEKNGENFYFHTNEMVDGKPRKLTKDEMIGIVTNPPPFTVPLAYFDTTIPGSLGEGECVYTDC